MDEGDLYRRVSRSIVKIYCDGSFFHGFVSGCDAHSAKVIASAMKFPWPYKDLKLELFFPDGTTINAKEDNIVIRDSIASIQCHFAGDGLDTNLVQALEICDNPLSLSEKIYTYSAYMGGYKGIITPGFLISIHEKYFHHNCCARKRSEDGALVINKTGELVGLCYDFKRYLISTDAVTILNAISDMY